MLGDKLKEFGYGLVSDGTDNHLVLWDLRSAGKTLPMPCVSSAFL